MLGQVALADKANEIVAIPHLLALLALDGCTVTIDQPYLAAATASE